MAVADLANVGIAAIAKRYHAGAARPGQDGYTRRRAILEDGLVRVRHRLYRAGAGRVDMELATVCGGDARANNQLAHRKRGGGVYIVVVEAAEMVADVIKFGVEIGRRQGLGGVPGFYS